MIEINDKKDCCGCGACAQRCPRQCIEMLRDEQGFLYPKVDASRCIECGLCERICPVINQSEPRVPERCLAAWNEDEQVRLNSSSGGVFYALAARMIEQGGVVFGARFNENWQVEHAWAETLDGVRQFMGSKYVQSRIGFTFAEAERLLKQGRKVLFSGTPCQIAGLKKFLCKDYGEQLLTVDVVCHGAPSPLVWGEYVKTLTARPQGAPAGQNTESTSSNGQGDALAIARISFRDKRLGWTKFGINFLSVARQGDENSESSSPSPCNEEQELLFEPHPQNLFMRGFLRDIYLRPSCYACPARCGKSGSDITLADFWGIQKVRPEVFDERGVSLVMIHNPQVSLPQGISATEVTYPEALASNPAIERDPKRPPLADKFWRQFSPKGLAALEPILRKMIKGSLTHRIIRKLKSIARKIIR